MSFTIHPFCENGNTVPQNCVHAGPVSLGLLRKDYKADTAQLWRAGINPSTNLLVASTTFSRGLVGSATTSTPRYWWIAGPRNDQASLETKVKEVVGRLPERALYNYVPFSDYVTAYDWAKTEGYALINCNYPAYRLGDYSADTESLINIESGFLPSFDGVQLKLRNLANPTPSNGFGALNPAAVPHDTIIISAPGVLGSPAPGIGSEGGISLLGTGHISQLVNPIQSGIDNGIVFEGIFRVPNGDPGMGGSSYTLLQARDPANNTLFSLGWDRVAATWRLNYGATLVNESAVGAPLATGGIYHFCVAIPTAASSIDDVILYINGIPKVLQYTPSAGSWAPNDVRFSFGSEFNGSIGSKQVQLFFSAKVHNLVAPWTITSADTFATTNWPIAQTLYGL
jgi:hypothetical protein